MVKLENGEYGPKATITAAWTPEMSRYLSANNVFDLELNHAKGWHGSDISFLRELPQLRAFTIIDLTIPSVQPIHFLHQLRHLKVITYCKTAIRFSEFPQLEDCSLEWRPKSESLFSCVTLKRLFVNRYRGKNVDMFSRLINLESLALLNAPLRNLLGLSSLQHLEHLRLGNLRQLASLNGIEGLPRLQELNINTCRHIGSIDQVGSLWQLRKLYLNNCAGIESFRPLENLKALESVIFWESTNIRDGDLSPLVHQKNLSNISFQNRRHYSHRREDFGAAYYGEELMNQMKRPGAKKLSDRDMVRKAMESSSRSFWQRISWR
jgi:hypothetical protein